MLEGIDISSGTLDYEKAAQDISFAYQKLTDGVGSPCKQAEPHCDGLRKAGLSDLGGYHFIRVRHGMKQDADEQCKQFLDAQAATGCTLPAWLDVEIGEEGNRNNRAATKDEVRAACELFWLTWDKCLGKTLPFYSSPGEMQAMGTWQIPAIINYPLALAKYVCAVGTAPAVSPGPPHLPPPFTSWAFHQYAGDVPRYGGIVDLVHFNGTIEQLRAL